MEHPVKIIWNHTVFEGQPYRTCGWEAMVNGKQYGSYILVKSGKDLSDEVRSEAESVIKEHARESIKLVYKCQQ